LNELNMLDTGKILLKLRRADLFNDLEDCIEVNLNTSDMKLCIVQEISRIEEVGLLGLDYDERKILSNLKNILGLLELKTNDKKELLYENLFMVINTPSVKSKENSKLYDKLELVYECYKKYINIVASKEGRTLFIQNENRKNKHRDFIMETLKGLPACHYSFRDKIIDQFKSYVFVGFIIDTDIDSLQWIDILRKEITKDKLAIDGVEIQSYYEDSLNVLEAYFPEYINKEDLDIVVEKIGFFLKSRNVGILSVLTN